jgi:hypothetical protein
MAGKRVYAMPLGAISNRPIDRSAPLPGFAPRQERLDFASGMITDCCNGGLLENLECESTVSLFAESPLDVATTKVVFASLGKLRPSGHWVLTRGDP